MRIIQHQLTTTQSTHVKTLWVRIKGIEMNIQVNTDSIEVARLESLVSQIADELVALSDSNDTVVQLDGSFINLFYAGRGTEQIQLHLSNDYRDKTRIAYQTDVLKRLEKIKNYILECAA